MLFLATFQTVLTPYDVGLEPSACEPTVTQVTRLVEADDELSAIAKIENAYEHSSPGSDSMRVQELVVTEVLK